MSELRFPAGGWLRPGTPVSWQRNDHGKDLVIPWQGIIQAPGSGHCITIGSDAPFPVGFGPHFACVHIEDGPWAGFDGYLGHDTALVASGRSFPFGTPLAIADQGHPNDIGVFPADPPGNGGWVEFGRYYPSTGRCGDNNPNGHDFDRLLMADMVVQVPNMDFGDQGLNILRMTGWLRDCGWLTRRWWHFNRQVHGAVEAFQDYHRITAPVGEVDSHTQLVLRRSAHWCRTHHHKEHHP